MRVERKEDSTFLLIQPHLINSVLSDLGLTNKSKSADTPAPNTVLLHKHAGAEPHAEPWDYRSVIGKLIFLEKSTRPELAFAVHQCARFSVNP